jgi:aldehyde dehydrogenase (NAD+)
VVVAKFHDQDDLIKMANDTLYGLGASVFSQDITKAITTANALHAGTVWINSHNIINTNVPFGGYKRT